MNPSMNATKHLLESQTKHKYFNTKETNWSPSSKYKNKINPKPSLGSYRCRTRDFQHGTIPGPTRDHTPFTHVSRAIAGSTCNNPPYFGPSCLTREWAGFNLARYLGWIAGSADPGYFLRTHSHHGSTRSQRCERGVRCSAARNPESNRMRV